MKSFFFRPSFCGLHPIQLRNWLKRNSGEPPRGQAAESTKESMNYREAIAGGGNRNIGA
jgi:hypothetical protein